MYQLLSYDHDGYNKINSGYDHTDFADTYIRALEILTTSDNHRYSQHMRINFDGNLLCEVHPAGARALKQRLLSQHIGGLS